MSLVLSTLLRQTKSSVKHWMHSFGFDIQTRRSLLRSAGSMIPMFEYLSERGFSPTWILDVGAHDAVWSQTAKQVFPKANCFLIEPQIEMQAHLDQFCQSFPGSRMRLAGAGAEPGELLLSVWDDLAGSTFLPSTEASTDQPTRKVEVVTIDQLIEQAELPIPELVKLDVQGFELEVLKGATRLFGQTEVLIIEVAFFEFLPGQPVFSDIVQFMHDRGYVVFDFAGFSRRPYDRALGQCDVCFVKQDSFLRLENRWS